MAESTEYFERVYKDATTGNHTVPQLTSGAQNTYETTTDALRNSGSATDAYYVIRQECNITVCDGTNAVAIGGGAAGDTHLMGILIAPAATPVTATIAGFTKKNDSAVEAAASIVVTGRDSDLADGSLYVDFKGAINDWGALTVTASVDEAVTVFWRPV